MRWDIKAKIQFFFEECCLDFIIDDGDGNIEVINFVDSIAEYPSQAVEVIDVVFEFFPFFIVFGCSIRWYPNTENVINVAFVCHKIMFVFLHNFIFMTGEENVGVINIENDPNFE